MALTFPLDLGPILRVMQVKFWLQSVQQLSRLGSGDVIAADLAPPCWMAEMTLVNMDHNDAKALQAQFEALEGSKQPFYLHDPRCAYPARDPNGYIIGAATPTVASVASNNREMTITGLPGGYVLSAGDMFHVDYGPSNKYRFLGRVITGGIAAGGTMTIEFRPPVTITNMLNGKTVRLVRPSAKMRLLPDAYDAGTTRQVLTSGMSFRASQVP